MQVLSLLVNHKCPYFWLSWFTRTLFLPLDLIFYFILLRRVGSLNLFVPSDPIRSKRMSPNTSEKTKGTKKSILASCLGGWPLSLTRVEWNGARRKSKCIRARCLTSSGSGPPSEHQSIELISGFTLVKPHSVRK